MEVDELASLKPNVEGGSESAMNEKEKLGVDESSNNVQSESVPQLVDFVAETGVTVLNGDGNSVAAAQPSVVSNDRGCGTEVDEISTDDAKVEEVSGSGDGGGVGGAVVEIERKEELEEDKVVDCGEGPLGELDVSRVAKEEDFALNVLEVGESLAADIEMRGEVEVAVEDAIPVSGTEDSDAIRVTATEAEGEIDAMPVTVTDAEGDMGEGVPVVRNDTVAEMNVGIPATGTETDAQTDEKIPVTENETDAQIAEQTREVRNELEVDANDGILVDRAEPEAVTNEESPMVETEKEMENGEPILAEGVETDKEIEVNMENDEHDSGPSKDSENGKDEDERMEEAGEDVEGESAGELNDSELLVVEDDELIAAEDDDVGDEKLADAEMATEAELQTEPVKRSGGGKRKRGGKISKPAARSTAPRKTIEEDVCFICFDGGDLVLCDRRNCPKAYHPSCVNRDEEFFQAKGRWNCGWHLCSICEKKAEYLCCTCPYSLCKTCIKSNVILCVREKEKKGFCETCMKTIMLIENKEQGNEGQVDFDDKSSWEYLFKDYWVDLKAKLNLSLDDLTRAKNPWKGFELAGKQESPVTPSEVKEGGSGSDNPSENIEARQTRRRAKKRLKSASKDEETSIRAVAGRSEGNAISGNTEWASKELLEFVMHMKNGDRSVISQFDVQALLLEYIKSNKLRDPRRKSQIMCDARLESLFGKARVGHFEMLKLLESHFLIKEDSQIDDAQGSVVDTEVSQLDDDETTETVAKGKDKKRKMRKKGDWRGAQYNRDDYAAIDIHNINLIYLRRKLVEDLLEDIERFHEKVVDTFVRIRILGTNQKLDIYRLVKVVGTSKVAEPYKLGKKTADIMLEILNLDKTEVISIDTISNQEFTEDECKRLRQSIKCGFITRLTVGDILTKAMDIQSVKVNDWLETEVVRLSHLRDRASETGRKKELRECVEKLQLLKTSEERARRLEEVPVIHSDPNMDPNNESEDDSDMEDKKQEVFKRSGSSSFNRRGMDPISPKGDFSSKDSWSSNLKHSSKDWEFSRNLSNKNFLAKVEDPATFEAHHESSWNQGRDKLIQQSNILKNPSSTADSEASPTNFPAPVVDTIVKINEAEKMWQYKDPSGKVQGPFSMVQLRKWSNSGYFPVNLKIWKMNEKEEDGILLTDALAGRFKPSDQRKEGQAYEAYNSHGSLISIDQSVSRSWTTPSVDVPKPSHDVRNDPVNLPSPTPKQSSAGWAGSSPLPGGNERLHSPTPDSSQLARSSLSSSLNAGGNKEPNAIGSLAFSSSALHTSSSINGPQTSEQGIIAGSQNSLQTSQSGHIVHSIGSQNTEGWGSIQTPNLHQNPSMNVAGQAQPYNQWGGGPQMVQNPAGNFLSQAPSTIPQPETWGQAQVSVPVNQPNNMQQQHLPSPSTNVNWGTLPANPNMGWMGSAPVNPSLNWGAAGMQGLVPGSVNPTCVMPTGPVSGNLASGWVASPSGNPGQTQGWIAGPIQGPVVMGNGNAGWVAPAGNQGQASGNTNSSWGAPTGNQGFTVQSQAPGNANQGWGPANEFQGSNAQGVAPGNTNPGWGSSVAGNQGWGSEQQQHNGDGYSGQRGNNGGSQGGDSGYHSRRPWNRGRGGPRDTSRSSGKRVCPYYPSGRCNMGSSCKYLHD